MLTPPVPVVVPEIRMPRARLDAKTCCSCDSTKPAAYHEASCDIGHERLAAGHAFQCADCGDIRGTSDRMRRRRDGRFATICLNCYYW